MDGKKRGKERGRKIVGEGLGRTDFYLEEVLGRAVDFFEGLLAGVWHCLHDGMRGGIGAVCVWQSVAG